MPANSMPRPAAVQPARALLLACHQGPRYSAPVAVNPVTGFGDPIFRMAHMRPKTIAGAFFVSAMSFYGGRAWETFGSAGVHSGRFANLRTAATHNRLATVCGSSYRPNGAPPMKHPHALNPSKIRAAAHRAMALAALRSKSSLAVRLNRYNHHRAIQRSLEAQADACDWLENLEGDAWADACEEIAAALKAKEVRHA